MKVSLKNIVWKEGDFYVAHVPNAKAAVTSAIIISLLIINLCSAMIDILAVFLKGIR